MSERERVAALLLRVAALAAACVVPLSFYPWVANPFGPPKLLLLTLATGLTLLAFALHPERLVGVWNSARQSRVAVAAGVFYVVALLSAAMSVSRLQSVVGSYPEYQGLVTASCWLVIALGAVSLGREGSWYPTLARGLALALLCVGVYAMLQRGGLDPFGPVNATSRQASSTLGNSSNLGVFLLLALPFALDRLRFDTVRGWRWLSGMSFALGLLGLVWAASRGAWLGFLGGTLVYVALEFRARRSGSGRRVAVAAVLLVTAFSIAIALTPSAASRARQAFDPSTGVDRWRLVLWRNVLDMASDRPVLGWGVNAVRFVYPEYRSADAGDPPVEVGVLGNAHNLVVDTAASLGFVGAIALLTWWITAGIGVWRLARAAPAVSIPAAPLGGALAAAAVAFMFHFPTLDTGSLIAVLMGLLVAGEGLMLSAEQEPASGVQRVRQLELPASSALRVSAWILVLLSLVPILGSAALIFADAAVLRARTAARSGEPWSQVRRELLSAQVAAPWEMQMWRAGSVVARLAIQTNSVVQPALDDGLADLTRALELAPRDISLVGDKADLLLVAASKSADREFLESGRRVIDQALRTDPNNAAFWTKKGYAIAAAGDMTEAIVAFERAAELAPNSRTAWETLARAYKAAGRAEDASRAEQQARDAVSW